MLASNPFAPPQTVDPAQRGPVWSPRAIGFIAFFLTFAPAGIMLALNYERYGKPEKKWPAIIATIVGFTLMMTVILLLPEKSPFDRMITWANIGIAIGLSRLQKEEYAQHVAGGGETRSPWRAAGISFAGVATALALIFVIAYGAETRDLGRFEIGRVRMEEGKYDEAKVIFTEYLKEHPDEAAAHYNLALIDLRQGRPHEAMTHALEYKRLAPNEPDAEALLDDVRAARE